MKSLAILAAVAVGLAGCQTIESPDVPDTPTTTTTTSTTTTTLPPVAATDACDQSGPLVEPPFTGKGLQAQGNAQECPVYQGMDIRFSVNRANGSRWLIATLFKDSIHKNADGTVTISCPTVDGYQYHVTGYAYNSSNPKKATAGNTFRYRTTTFVFADCRKASP